MVLWDTDPKVTDTDFQERGGIAKLVMLTDIPPLWRWPHNQVNSASFRGIADGILQQVFKHLTQALPIALDRGNFLCLLPNFIAALEMKGEAISERFGDVPMSESNGFPRKRREIEQAHFDLHKTRFEFGNLDQSRQQKLHMLTRLLDDLEKLVVFLLRKLSSPAQ